MKSAYQKVNDVFSRLPREPQADIRSETRQTFLESRKTIVVLDDDPTGTQTCYDVVVLTQWNVSLLVKELEKHPSILFILTNSRSLGESDAIDLAAEIGSNLVEASRQSGRQITLISRSDSTLRGHFPAEVDAVARALRFEDAVRILVPAFIEGGRYTIGDVHYIREEENLVPVSETPFARDTVFGYRSSNLKSWVEEKTKGRISASSVASITLEDIRITGSSGVCAKLRSCTAGGVCIANACSHKDLEILVAGILEAELQGSKFIYRTSATFVPIRAGLRSGKIFAPSKQRQSSGSLVIVGSHVPKTTRQLEKLLELRAPHAVEIHVPTILNERQTDNYAEQIIQRIDEQIGGGTDVVVFTSRKLETGIDAQTSLLINNTVSAFLVKIVKGISNRPANIVSKGGVTSSDVASKGLGATKALVLGQIIPGVPVWKMDPDSKFPDLIYTVFPGNVGDDNALVEVYTRLKM